MKISYEAIGKNVRGARMAAGLSLKETAERTQMCVEYLENVEKGERPASLDTLAELCQALEVPLARLLEGAIVDGRF